MVKQIGAHIVRLIFFYITIYFIIKYNSLKLFLMVMITLIPFVQFYFESIVTKKWLIWLIANLDALICFLIFLIYLFQENFRINYLGFILTGIFIYFTSRNKKVNN
ncbi:hypothetical protein [Gottfriedia luciferensis]|uniref:hypothetical protein n=1 Tax=Gottfriedia luciferensis TaxID=178774 RepID=UPI000B42F22E|nr:hypothetical protein [Gottfriedia luciferensis]